MEANKAKDVTVFVDESGTIAKGVQNKRDYFIITLLFIENDRVDYVKKMFKKYRLQVAKKKPSLMEELKVNSEIKGSMLSEKEKSHIYTKLLEKCGQDFEIAIIVLDNKASIPRLRMNSSRAFNYLIQLYLEKCFKKCSKYKNLNSIKFIIDERNVVTESKYTLKEYLNTQLNLITTFANEDIEVRYHDSKNFLLLQLTDFISNTFYRKIQKNIEDFGNTEKLLAMTCKCNTFKFPPE